MALPTLNDVSAVDPVLQNILVGFAQAENRFVALNAFPGISVAEASGTFYKFTQKYWFMDGLAPRAPGAPFARGGIGVETDTYETLQWGKEYPIPDEIEAANQTPMSLQMAGVRWLAQQSFIRKERAFAADFMKTSVWGTDDNNSATDWDDSSGVPITNVRTASRTISQATGMMGNTMVCGEIVYDALLVNAQVLGTMQYTNTVTIAAREQLLAAVLGLDALLVSRAIYNSANEGQTAVYAPVIDDDALIYYNNPTAGIFDATAGKTFVWNPGGGAGSVRTYTEDQTDSQIIKHKEQWDQKLIASALGYFFADIV
jgi:hypothetical protein